MMWKRSIVQGAAGAALALLWLAVSAAAAPPGLLALPMQLLYRTL